MAKQPIKTDRVVMGLGDDSRNKNQVATGKLVGAFENISINKKPVRTDDVVMAEPNTDKNKPKVVGARLVMACPNMEN